MFSVVKNYTFQFHSVCASTVSEESVNGKRRRRGRIDKYMKRVDKVYKASLGSGHPLIW